MFRLSPEAEARHRVSDIFGYGVQVLNGKHVNWLQRVNSAVKTWWEGEIREVWAPELGEMWPYQWRHWTANS